MKKRIPRRLVLLFLLPLLLCALCPRVAAEEEVDTALPEEYAALLEALPDEVITRLPDGFFSQDGESVADATWGTRWRFLPRRWGCSCFRRSCAHSVPREARRECCGHSPFARRSR